MQIFLVLTLLLSHQSAAEPAFPPAHTRSQMVLELAAEMERLDGEALFVRKNRTRAFSEIAQDLSGQAARASDWHGLFKVFSRLDNAYPNLHSYLQPGKWWKGKPTNLRPLVQFRADWLEPKRVEYRISSVAKGSNLQAQIGDRLIAINGKSMKEWGTDYFEFCKMPLREQCEAELPSRIELDGKPLLYTLERNGRRWQIEVPVAEIPVNRRRYEPCEEDSDLYEGFTLAYAGRYACFFEKNDDPSIILLRIRIFHYEDKSHTIHSVRSEVEAFWPWWKERAPRTKHLVIDLADNGGGNFPGPYYEVFFPKPFQEQWVSFRKLPEMLDPKLRASIFWGEPAQEIWFQNLLQEGVWEKTAEGDFLPPVPMFCTNPRKDCREGFFSPRNHGFRGQVTLVVNSSCVSACDGFVYAFKDEMGARVVGQPQAADSAYSRLTINVLQDEFRGFRLEVEPLGEEGSALFSQTIAFSRSVTADGTVESGIPVPVNHFVPRTFDQSPQQWRRAAVKAALE